MADDRRAFRVDPTRNLGQQFTGAGRIVQKGGVAVVLPNATPEQQAAYKKAQGAAAGEAKKRQDATAKEKAETMRKRRYRSARATGLSHSEAAAKTGYTGPPIG